MKDILYLIFVLSILSLFLKLYYENSFDSDLGKVSFIQSLVLDQQLVTKPERVDDFESKIVRPKYKVDCKRILDGENVRN